VYVSMTRTAVAVPVTNVDDAVVRVFPIVMLQLEVFSVADIDTSETYDALAVLVTATLLAVVPMNTAVAVCSGTSIKYHAVPSFAIAQLVADVAVEVIGKNRLTALTVLGVLVTFRNVTVLEDKIDHAPVNVQTRNVFGANPWAAPYLIASWSLSPPSTERTTLAIRSAAGRVNATRSTFAGLPSGFADMRHLERRRAEVRCKCHSWIDSASHDRRSTRPCEIAIESDRPVVIQSQHACRWNLLVV